MNSPTTFLQNTTRRFQESVRQTELRGALLFVRAKAAAALLILLIVLAWLIFKPANIPERVAYKGVLGAFLALQGAQLYLLKRDRYAPWMPYFFVALEMAAVTLALLLPNPFFTEAGLPLQVSLHFNNVLPMMVLIAGTALAYSPSLVLWSGACAAVFWSAGMALIWRLPDTQSLFSEEALDIASANEFLAYVYRWNFVDVYGWLRDIMILLLTSGILAVAVHQTRRFMREHAAAERQRGNLARYFSPNMVDELSALDAPLEETRQHEVAILFVDIVGYSTLAEKMAPDRVMGFLREFHRRMEAEVFRFGGTMDKYIGDAVMATFGAPRKGERDAADALGCARRMVHTVTAWNAERAARGEPPVRIGIGLHYGPAIMGDVGTERHASFAVLGVTTNTASRLERLTRELNVAVVASQTFLDTVRNEGVRRENEEDGAGREGVGHASADDLLAGFVDAGTRGIRGREDGLRLWTLTEDLAAAQRPL